MRGTRRIETHREVRGRMGERGESREEGAPVRSAHPSLFHPSFFLFSFLRVLPLSLSMLSIMGGRPIGHEREKRGRLLSKQ